jgi:acyl dehydratase
MTLVSALAVGSELDPFDFPPITRTTLALFAGASADHNPIHIDIDAARAADRDDVFAHGMLVMAYVGRYLTDRISLTSIRSLQTRFVSITPVHAVVRCTGRVSEVDDTGSELRVTIDIVARLADGTAVLEGTAVVGPQTDELEELK